MANTRNLIEQGKKNNVRVGMGHGKPGKSGNLLFQFLGLESHGI